MVTAGIFPFRENSHGRTRNRTRDLMISSQRLWPLDHKAGLKYKYQLQKYLKSCEEVVFCDVMPSCCCSYRIIPLSLYIMSVCRSHFGFLIVSWSKICNRVWWCFYSNDYRQLFVLCRVRHVVSLLLGQLTAVPPLCVWETDGNPNSKFGDKSVVLFWAIPRNVS